MAIAINDLARVKKIEEDGGWSMSDYSQSDSEKPKVQLEQIVIHEPEVVADVKEVMDYELSRTQEPDFNKNDGWAMSDYPNYDKANFNRQNSEKGTDNTVDFPLPIPPVIPICNMVYLVYYLQSASIEINNSISWESNIDSF